LFDAFNSPEFLLHGDVRRALWQLTENNTEQANNLRFLEELALVGGFSHEQVTSFIVPSEAERRQFDPPDGQLD